MFQRRGFKSYRQPEFTQLDIEMSFVELEDVTRIIEGLAKTVFTAVTGETADYEFPKMEYKEAMERYGSDKPDTRFGVELKDLTDIAAKCGFKAFTSTVEAGGIVKAVVAPGVADTFSRKILSDYEEYVKRYFGAKGMAWIKLTAEGVNSPIAKFFTEEEMNAVIERTGAKTGDVIIIVADKPKVVLCKFRSCKIKTWKRSCLFTTKMNLNSYGLFISLCLNMMMKKEDIKLNTTHSLLLWQKIWINSLQEKWI